MLKKPFDGATGKDAAQAPAGLDGFYIVRGYNEGQDFSSIMDLPKDEAVRVMEERAGFRGRGPARTDGTRDQEAYYADRKASDDWLRAQRSETDARLNPVFFSLTDDPQHFIDMNDKNPNGYDKVMVIPVSKLDMTQWSFTFDDSMGNYFSRGGNDRNPDTENFLTDSHPLHGTVMDARSAAQAITQYGTRLNDGSGREREIEAQFWGPAFDPVAMGGHVVKKSAQEPALRKERDGPA